MGMEFKSFGFKIDEGDRSVAREQRVIKGYGSTFEPAERADCYGDIVLPGAFDQTLAEDFPAGKIKLFARHWEPIGMPLVLRADAKGLYIEARVSKTMAGDDALELALDGVLNEMSIGFEIVDSDIMMFSGKEIRRLKRIKLYEVSLVPWGANPYAQVTEAIKSFGRVLEFREGRVLSKANFELLLKARESLDTVIGAASPKDEDEKTAEPMQEPQDTKALDALSEQLKQLQAIIKA
jgi:HK97 family phage prohead protease